MNPRRITVALLVAGASLATSVTSATAQGIGDVAARERAKRAEQTQANKAKPKQLTNDDLNEGRPPGAKTPDATATPSQEGAGGAERPPAESPAEDSPAEERRQQERQYLEAVTAAQAQVSSVEERMRGLSDKLNPMSGSYIYGSRGSNDANEELRVREQLRQAESELQSARQAVVTANQALEDFRQGRLSREEDQR